MSKAKSLYDLLVGFIEECDMVSVVRCKDCRYYIPYSDHCGMHQVDMNRDDYCSYGERKDGEADDNTGSD